MSEMKPLASQDDETAYCRCQWVSPEDGVIRQRWPAELASDCPVHGHDSYRTHDREEFDPEPAPESEAGDE